VGRLWSGVRDYGLCTHFQILALTAGGASWMGREIVQEWELSGGLMGNVRGIYDILHSTAVWLRTYSPVTLLQVVRNVDSVTDMPSVR